MKILHMISWILLVVGGLNWLLVVFGMDLATWGLPEIVAQVVYVLVGLSALLQLVTHRKDCKVCGSPMTQTSAGGM